MSEGYWANLEGQKLSDAMKERMDKYDRYIEGIGRIERLRKSWEFMNGLTEGANGLRRGGKAGELVRISVGNYRAFANNIHVLLTQAKSYFECQAENMDFKSQVECVLGKSIVDYYNDEAKIGAKFSQGVLTTLGFGEYFLELDWDESKGREFARNPATGKMERGGDITARSHNSLNVARDTYAKSSEHTKWYVIRDYLDKYELAATYPEHSQWILEQKGPGLDSLRTSSMIYQKLKNPEGDTGDNVEVLKLYHDKTKVCDQGVEALSIGGRLIFKMTLDEHYGELPVKRLCAGDIEGTFLPYSPLWDLIPLCEAADFLTTAAITNAMNLAFTNIWSQDPNLKMEQLTTAMGKVTSATKPEALNLAQNSPEIQKQLDMIHQKSQFLTGINSVAAGQPEAVSNIKSGNGLALILSTAVQFQSVVQERYADFRGEVMGLLIKILQKNAKLPMLIAIAGKGKASEAKTFKQSDILSIRRVKCAVGSPIMATIGGRMQVADNIASKYPNSVSVNAYIAVLQTGNLDHIEGQSFSEQLALIEENEDLSEGREVVVNILENHPAHIMKALEIISTPGSKENPELVRAVNAHVLEHLKQWDILTKTLPQLLPMIGIPPLAAAPMPMDPSAQGPGAPSDAGQSQAAVPSIEPNLPNMPTLPAAAPEGAQAAYASVNQNPMGALQ